MSNKIVHICKNEKFIPDFINFTNDNFKEHDISYYIYGNKNKFVETTVENVSELEMDLLSLIRFIKLMNSSDKLIFHGLFSFPIILIVFFQPWLSAKLFWKPWGGDFYPDTNLGADIVSRVKFKIKKHTMKRFDYVINSMYKDFGLISDIYSLHKTKHVHCFTYPSNLFEDKKNIIKTHSCVVIQVGNSGAIENNHIDVFNKIEGLVGDQDYKIICPLSYGDSVYISKVKAAGHRAFGDRFISLDSFILLDEYLAILSSVDIAIFAHNRQQAMGNIRKLLGYGVKVYIKRSINTFDYFENLGVKLFPLDELDLSPEFEEKESNICLISSIFSEKRLISDWNNIYNLP